MPETMPETGKLPPLILLPARVLQRFAAHDRALTEFRQADQPPKAD